MSMRRMLRNAEARESERAESQELHRQRRRRHAQFKRRCLEVAAMVRRFEKDHKDDPETLDRIVSALDARLHREFPDFYSGGSIFDH